MKTVRIDLPPTATPHQDAQRLANETLRKNAEEKVKQPGADGTAARVQLAMLIAYGEAFAKELDFDGKPSDINCGFANAIGDVAASLLSSIILRADCSDEEKLRMLEHGLEQIMGCALGRGLHESRRILGGTMGDDEFTALSYDVGPPPGKA